MDKPHPLLTCWFVHPKYYYRFTGISWVEDCDSVALSGVTTSFEGISSVFNFDASRDAVINWYDFKYNGLIVPKTKAIELLLGIK